MKRHDLASVRLFDPFVQMKARTVAGKLKILIDATYLEWLTNEKCADERSQVYCKQKKAPSR